VCSIWVIDIPDALQPDQLDDPRDPLEIETTLVVDTRALVAPPGLTGIGL
jgi:hypothetical protein